MRHQLTQIVSIRERRKDLLRGTIGLLILIGTDLPHCRAQLEYNGGYVQTHREDHGQVPPIAAPLHGARPPANTPPSDSPDHDRFSSFYYRAKIRSSQPPPSETAQPATLVAHLPENAVLWVEETRTRSTGRTRYFQSPPLPLGRRYCYHLRAAWIEDGKLRSQTQTVFVQAGLVQPIDFRSK